ncbi:MAG: hypothetical protein N2447_09865, partial [Thermoanaerobaculum sp.]|nr:hypothetical protein [Thermoanaerobaculum sp.]
LLFFNALLRSSFESSLKIIVLEVFTSTVSCDGFSSSGCEEEQLKNKNGIMNNEISLMYFIIGPLYFVIDFA